MIGQRISISLLIVSASAAFSGCTTHLDQISDGRAQPDIGFLDGKYKVCREDCPVPTPKELDDSVPVEFLAYELMNKAMPVPAPKPAPQPILLPMPAAPEKKDESPITTQTFDIYFDFGMSRPNKEGKKGLLRFAESMKNLGNQKIELVGKTDDIGTKKFNRRLAFKRALYVETWLRSHGVNAQIAISAREECCRAAPYDKREQTLKVKRSVTIISHH